MTHLMNYSWPGNVRELENCIQQALALGSAAAVQVNDLPPHVISQVGDAKQEASGNSLQELERRAILEALEQTGGDRVRAARLLGIGKTTIYRKVKEYGLEESAAPSSASEREKFAS